MAVEERYNLETSTGFQGAVEGLALPDVIQINGHNRFTGCISVEYGNQTGVIFFRDGDIIHAEQGDVSGDLAFFKLLEWPGGKFKLQPKVTTTSHTIKQSLNYLLLEAHRLMDERREEAVNGSSAMKEQDASSPKEGAKMGGIVAKIKAISAVDHAVLLGKDGTPVDDTSFAGESLAAQALYLAMIGNRLGEIFGVGEIKSAAVQGRDSHLLMYESRNHYLSIAAKGSAQLGSVETDVRQVLAPKK